MKPRERKSLGLLFKPDLHQAILRGHKTQTRRMVSYSDYAFEFDAEGRPHNTHVGASPFRRYKVGDQLYVKEKLLRAGDGADADGQILPGLLATYASDGAPVPGVMWRWTRDWLSPMHMPRAAARTTMILTADVRFERVTDVSDEDALAEGVRPLSKEWERPNKVVKYAFLDDGDISSVPWTDMPRTPREAFLDRWAKVYGDWTLKAPVPFVAVFTFAVEPVPRIFLLNEQHEVR